MKCRAQQAIETYHHCDNIADCFKAGMGDCNMDSIRSHTQAAMKGRFIVSFFALTVLSESRRRMRKPMNETKSNGETVRYKPVGDEMNFRELMNYLNNIKVIDGQTAEDVRLAEVTESQRLLARRLECEGVYDSVPEYAKKDDFPASRRLPRMPAGKLGRKYCEGDAIKIVAQAKKDRQMLAYAAISLFARRNR